MDESKLTKLLHQLADEGVPDDLDLRPRIHRRLEMSKAQPQKGVFSMKASFAQPRRLAALIMTFVLLLLAAFLLTPQGRTWAQNALQFFTYAESDSQPIITLAPGEESTWHFNLSIAEAESLAGFDVLEPAWLPDVLSFTGAEFEPERRIIRIFYGLRPEIYGEGLETNGIVLTEIPITEGAGDCEICGEPVGASAFIETVQIGGLTGQYVVGVWKGNDESRQWEWESDPYLQSLRWQSDSMAFELLYMGLPEDVTKADLIAIAESLHLSSASAPSQASTPSWGKATFATVAEAEAATKIDILGFPFPLPGLVLESVDVNSNTVFLVYEAIGGGGYLTFEQRFDDFSDGPWQSVPQKDVEIVWIGDLAGEFVGGYFTAQDSKTMDWTADASVFRLRWRDGDRLFELRKEGDVVPLQYLDRDNLIALAKSLYDPTVQLDLQSGTFKFKNVMDSAVFTSLEIIEPYKLPDGFVLNEVQITMPQKWVDLEYKIGNNARLTVSQQPVADLNQSDLAIFFPTCSIEAIQIGSYSGWYIVDENHFRAIMWTSSQNNFAIYFEATPNSSLQLDQADLIAIAESMR